nr:MAG TPA: YopX protein [Caudoviricetes sp.]
MNREILFKAKRKDNGEWVEGGYFSEPYTDKKYIVRWNSFGIGFNEFIEVNPDTICQYTGLADKNGKKIWENDIVEVAGEDGYFKCEWDEDTARFALNGDGLMVDFDNYWSYQVEVVGNIFDNAELLEVE